MRAEQRSSAQFRWKMESKERELRQKKCCRDKKGPTRLWNNCCTATVEAQASPGYLCNVSPWHFGAFYWHKLASVRFRISTVFGSVARLFPNSDPSVPLRWWSALDVLLIHNFWFDSTREGIQPSSTKITIWVTKQVHSQRELLEGNYFRNTFLLSTKMLIV